MMIILNEDNLSNKFNESRIQIIQTSKPFVTQIQKYSFSSSFSEAKNIFKFSLNESTIIIVNELEDAERIHFDDINLG